MLVQYFHQDESECEGCELMTESNIKKYLSRFIRESPLLTWDPVRNDIMGSHLETTPDGGVKRSLIYRDIRGGEINDRMDEGVYTPLLHCVYRHESQSFHPFEDLPVDRDDVMEYPLITLRMIMMELLETFIDLACDLTDNQKEVVLSEELDGTHPWLIPKYDPDEFQWDGWHTAFEEVYRL